MVDVVRHIILSEEIFCDIYCSKWLIIDGRVKLIFFYGKCLGSIAKVFFFINILGLNLPL